MFKQYAKHYNLCYKDKPYKKEIEFIYKWANQPKTILDISCGTGEHALGLALIGCNVIGQDISKEMIQIAKIKKSHKSGINLKYKICPMQKFYYKDKFDCIICMFSSIDYLIKDKDIVDTFTNVFKSLKINGKFIFDFWNKNCVEKYFSPIRKTKFKQSFTVLEKENNLAHITFLFGNDGIEYHLLRYHNIENITNILKSIGFKNVATFPFMEKNRNVINEDWNIQVIATK